MIAVAPDSGDSSKLLPVKTFVVVDDDLLSSVVAGAGAGEIDGDYVDAGAGADGVSSLSDNVGVGENDADDSPADCADGIGTVETFAGVAAVSLSGVAEGTFVVAAVVTGVTAVTVVDVVVQIDHDYCSDCDPKSRSLVVVNVVVMIAGAAAIVVMGVAAIVAGDGVKSVKRRWKDSVESDVV